MAAVASTAPLTSCIPTGCGVVFEVRTSPRVITYSGASCGGPGGAWYLNAAEGGPNTAVSVSSHLVWDFAGQNVAYPAGQLIVNSGSGSFATITLGKGKLTIKGTTPRHVEVMGRGTLTVHLTGSRASPTLTTTEQGLSNVEKELGMVSAFDIGGRPLELHIRIQSDVQDC
jgi:hypothetical protein